MKWYSLLVLPLLLTGCVGATYNVAESMQKGGYRKVLEDTRNIEEFPERDQTLILNWRAQAKLGLGYQESARNDFMRSWNMMNNSQGGNVAAAYMWNEKSKYYLGEPYERMMNSYYLGLLFYMHGKPEDAMACFKNALYVDTGDLEANEYAADFVPNMIMRSRVYIDRRDDNGLKAQLDELNRLPKDARNFDPNCPWFTPEAQKEANTLIWVELGWGPYMTAEGRHGEVRVIREPEYPERYAEVFINGQSLGKTYKMGDTYYQATTRGGRPMEEYLKAKGIAKDVTTVAGAVAIGVGAELAREGHGAAGAITAGVGLGLLLWGALSSAEADTRCNVLLPGQIHLMMAKVPPGKHEVEVRYYDGSGRELGRQRQRALPLNVPERGDAVMIVRSDPHYVVPRNEKERAADPYAKAPALR
ncbi:hypothetical protein EDM80_06825 [bacterium]|nr:MAG: hypothetical protein EDM80_06825 [bacterium]RIK63898.1 MAG: hypothetical protein DCC64_05685 [Planctomycetota bacterium]